MLETFFSRFASFNYFAGATVGVLSVLAMPLTYGGMLWEINVLVLSAALLLVTLTALSLAVVLLSKNFPIHFSLVIGTVLGVTVAGQWEGVNTLLSLLQLIALALLGLFVFTRLLVEAVEAKNHAH